MKPLSHFGVKKQHHVWLWIIFSVKVNRKSDRFLSRRFVMELGYNNLPNVVAANVPRNFLREWGIFLWSQIKPSNHDTLLPSRMTM